MLLWLISLLKYSCTHLFLFCFAVYRLKVFISNHRSSVAGGEMCHGLCSLFLGFDSHLFLIMYPEQYNFYLGCLHF